VFIAAKLVPGPIRLFGPTQSTECISTQKARRTTLKYTSFIANNNHYGFVLGSAHARETDPACPCRTKTGKRPLASLTVAFRSTRLIRSKKNPKSGSDAEYSFSTP